jgi:hypothetical protein
MCLTPNYLPIKLIYNQIRIRITDKHSNKLRIRGLEQSSPQFILKNFI